MNESRKYCRSLHAPISLGTTSDDRFIPAGYLEAFANMEKHILTEKLDGQNNCFNKHGVFARSHTSPSVHPWDKPMRERWELIKNDLGELEIFGENMYGIHSIAYKQLESYYYVFAVREGDRWLSWEEVKFYAAMLDFPTVPEIKITVPLDDVYNEDEHEDDVLRYWLTKNLGMDWEEFVDTSGYLGGYDPETGIDSCEGLVIRNADGFTTNGGEIKVQSNEFNNLMKLVRKSHVKTNVHWSKTWKPATLIDYRKHGWLGYEYMNNL
jgi:hypothetical protein